MLEEITEPQHWRINRQHNASRNASWSARRRSRKVAGLAAEAVDAALTEEADRGEKAAQNNFDSSKIINDLASQLDLLEKQREQLQRLLAQAKAGS